MTGSGNFRERPRWVTDYLFIESLLIALIEKLDQGKKPQFIIKKSKRFSPLYEFSDNEAAQYWRLLLALEHDYEVICLSPPKKPPQMWEPEYQGYKVAINPKQENLLRHWLNRPAFDPYRLTWQEAINNHQTVLAPCKDYLFQHPLRITDRSAKEVVAAIVALAKYYQDNPTQIPLTLRELSAICFWGHSKYLEQHKAWVETLFPGLIARIKIRPLMVEALVPESFNQVLFIENQDTFLRACQGFFAATKNTAIIYSAGFRASGQQKRRDKSETVFAYINSYHQPAIHEFETWWLQESGEAVVDESLGIYFWGDLDFAGMGILASLHNQFPTIKAWSPAYNKMLAALEKGIGHTAEEADKKDQLDPKTTGCDFADNTLLPALRNHRRFVDQELVQSL